MRKLILVILVIFGMAFGGCMVPFSSYPAGFVMTDLKYPSLYKGVSNQGPGKKKGSSMAKTYVWIVTQGDASIEAACKEGNITKIRTADHEIKMVLFGAYAEWSTTVTGD